MKPNKSNLRIGFLFHAIASLLANPLPNNQQLGRYRRELHFASGGSNPIYFPKRKKLKGWQKENKRYN